MTRKTKLVRFVQKHGEPADPSESPDAGGILEAEEWDADWYAARVPLSYLTCGEDPGIPADEGVGGGSKYRLQEIRDWAKTVGGLTAALEAAPLLVDMNGWVMDGNHRCAVWFSEYGNSKSIPALVGDFDAHADW